VRMSRATVVSGYTGLAGVGGGEGTKGKRRRERGKEGRREGKERGEKYGMQGENEGRKTVCSRDACTALRAVFCCAVLYCGSGSCECLLCTLYYCFVMSIAQPL